MRIRLNRNRHREGVIACILAILALVVGVIIIYKLVTFCQKYLPTTPPPNPPPNQTNNPANPTNPPPDIAGFVPYPTGGPAPSAYQSPPPDGPGFYVDYVMVDDGTNPCSLVLTNYCIAVPSASADSGLTNLGMPDLSQQSNWTHSAFSTNGVASEQPTNVVITSSNILIYVGTTVNTATIQNGQLVTSSSSPDSYTVVLYENTNSPFDTNSWVPCWTDSVPPNVEMSWKDTNDPATNAHTWYRGQVIRSTHMGYGHPN